MENVTPASPAKRALATLDELPTAGEGAVLVSAYAMPVGVPWLKPWLPVDRPKIIERYQRG